MLRLLNLCGNFLAVLLLTFMALGMVSSCSSTEETSDNPEENISCEIDCAEGDRDCKEACLRGLEI